jgi:predicted acylesterase/phospholipase RssA
VLQEELREILPELALPADAPATVEAIDGCETDLAALCLSGGGIRSATYALGVLQGLARFGLLGQFHYLSTVSGGGYIGSWLSAWRAIEADERIFEALNSSQRTAVEPRRSGGCAPTATHHPHIGFAVRGHVDARHCLHQEPDSQLGAVRAVLHGLPAYS